MTGTEFSLFAHGGPMLWVILALAATAAVLFLERTLYLHRGQIRSKPFLDGIKNTLDRRRLVEALTLCEETPGPVAAVVKAAIRNAGRDINELRHAVQEAAIVEVPALERRLGSIAAIAQVAPLVGLLGTVIGLMSTFHAFMQGGEFATSVALSRGMWQALIAVAGSLLLAIPTHLAYHFLTGRVRAVVRDVEWAAHEIVQYLTSEYKGRGVEPVAADRTPAAGEG